MSKEHIEKEEGERARKYISFREIPPLAKTRRFYIEDKNGQPFAIIKWYGGCRRDSLTIRTGDEKEMKAVIE